MPPCGPFGRHGGGLCPRRREEGRSIAQGGRALTGSFFPKKTFVLYNKGMRPLWWIVIALGAIIVILLVILVF